MGDIVVENPANILPPHKKASPSAIPTIDNFEGLSTEGGDDYATLKKLQRQLEYVIHEGRYGQTLTVESGTFSCKRNTSRMSKG